MSALTCFRLTDAAGSSWLVDMAPGVTLADAREHFLGHVQIEENQVTGEETKLPAVVSVEQCANEIQRAGFDFAEKRIFFAEGKGKDAGMNRWRVCLYYAPHLALTEFFASAEAYAEFMAMAKIHSFPTYEEYRNDAEHENADEEGGWGK